MNTTDEILALFARHGAEAYGERLSMIDHSLQTAHFARADAAPAALVVAALLHDVGHLLTDDARHDDTGARWLAERFAPDVSEPVRLHVAAKRYLCAADGNYFSTLSAASIASLKLQGGPMSAAEAAQFAAEPYHTAAIELRHWDDRGKIAGFATPDLGSYRDLLRRMATIASG